MWGILNRNTAYNWYYENNKDNHNNNNYYYYDFNYNNYYYYNQAINSKGRLRLRNKYICERESLWGTTIFNSLIEIV